MSDDKQEQASISRATEIISELSNQQLANFYTAAKPYLPVREHTFMINDQNRGTDLRELLRKAAEQLALEEEQQVKPIGTTRKTEPYHLVVRLKSALDTAMRNKQTTSTAQQPELGDDDNHAIEAVDGNFAIPINLKIATRTAAILNTLSDTQKTDFLTASWF